MIVHPSLNRNLVGWIGAVVVAAGCSYNPRTAQIAVHNGTHWEVLDRGNTITTLRDNPPLTGLVQLQPRLLVESGGTALDRGGDARCPGWAGTVCRHWLNGGYRIGGTSGHTFRDALNPDGLLGIAHVSSTPPASDGGIRLTDWHSNGLLLEPGTPVSLNFQELVFTGPPYRGRWGWQTYSTGSGNVVLAQNTHIAGVNVLVLDDNVPWPVRLDVPRDMAEMWLDGRTVENRAIALSAGGHSDIFSAHLDPRPSWVLSNFDDPNQGRGTDSLALQLRQEADSVWTYCGANFGMNIQFRLRAYARMNPSDVPQSGTCVGILDRRSDFREMQSCVNAWTAFARDTFGMNDSNVWLVITKHFDVADSPGAIATVFGVTKILWSQTELAGGTGASLPANVQNTLAHELGHVLGRGSALFADQLDGMGRPIPGNLMGNSAPILNRPQCELAYANSSP
jgi:hypothetical protein